MIECQIWPDSGDFAPVSASFSVAPKVGETISVLVEGGARSFIVTGVSPVPAERQHGIRLSVREAAQP